MKLFKYFSLTVLLLAVCFFYSASEISGDERNTITIGNEEVLAVLNEAQEKLQELMERVEEELESV